MKTLKTLILVGIVFLIASAFKSSVEEDGWVVPEKYKNMKNPTDPKVGK